jgi:hypothetical protein
MKMLIDDCPGDLTVRQARFPGLILGQFQTPASNYADAGGSFAINNGAFKRFDEKAFRRLLAKMEPAMDRCLFVTIPDVVGSARRTLEVFHAQWYGELHDWPTAFVLQDGIEDLPIPWACVSAVFVGGSTKWKMSAGAAQCVKAAKLLGKHVRAGRVNTVKRWRHFEALGADTCDGTGIAMYDWMLEAIAAGETEDRPLLRTA